MQNFYKCDRDSEIGRKIKNFHHAAIRAANKAEGFAKMFGASAYIQPIGYFEGGVDFLEFKKEPDLEMWRKRTELGDTPYYEPRCVCNIKWHLTKDKTRRPANTWNIIYKGEYRKWEEIKNTMPLEYWAKKAKYVLSDNKNKDRAEIEKLLANHWCLCYLEFSGDQTRINGKVPQSLHRAVAAEKMRMKLPVLKVETLLKILGFKWPENAKGIKVLSLKIETPTFFVFNDKYYICTQGECTAKNLEEIDNKEYTFAQRVIESMQSCR